jgi:hypothetical protein
MKRFGLILPFVILLSDPAWADSVPPAWVQLVPGGGAEVRTLVATGETTCPTLVADGKDLALAVRTPGDTNFPTVCSAAIPTGAKALALKRGGAATPVALPPADPQRILVLGDTGCRIKGTAVQACNDPRAWPFAGLAQAAANLKPDLVIHLGDYLYRETPCPAAFAGCAGSPYGDNWETWNADFFTPAAPLLAAAPWIIVRGNHEDCFRAGPGFLRLLGPVAFDPTAPCTAHLEPYAVMAGPQWIAVVDDANASDTSVDDTVVPSYQKDFATLTAIANTGPGHELWLVAHRPIWGAISGPLGLPVGGNATLIKAAGDLSAFAAISLMLSGHIHTFEAINYDAKVPPQIIAGHGGDNLDVTPTNLKGTIFQGSSGVHVKDGLSVHGFGFLLMTRVPEGWTLQLYDSDGTPETQCQFKAGRVFCPQQH